MADSGGAAKEDIPQTAHDRRVAELVAGVDAARDEGPTYLEAVHRLLCDPFAVIEHNHQHRHADRDGEDLLTLADLGKLAAIGPVPVPVPVIELLDSSNAPGAIIDQETYNERHRQCRPFAASLLDFLRGEDLQYTIVTAGGAAMDPLLPTRQQIASDDDFFVVGCRPGHKNHEKWLWAAADAFLRGVRHVYTEDPDSPPADEWVETIAPGLITMTADIKHKLQLILTVNRGSAIYGFDLPCCCIQTDGVTTQLTPFGAHAALTRTNIVVPEYSSISFEFRCAKKMRAHDLALPHLDPASFLLEGFALSRMFVRPTKRTANRATAIITVDSTGVSDYEAGVGLTGEFYDAEYKIAYNNAAALVAGSGRYTMMACTGRGDDVALGYNLEQLDVREWHVGGGPPTSDIVTEKALKFILDRVSKSLIYNMKVSRRKYAKYLAMTDTEFIRFRWHILQWADRTGKCIGTIATKKPLKPFRRRVRDLYQRRIAGGSERTAWWIDIGSKKTYTASFNPRPMTPQRWYGKHLAPEPSLLEPGELAERDGDVCAICLEAIAPGEAEVTLACGHRFHLMSAECGGILGLVRRDCPMCRRKIQPPVAETTDEFDVDWSFDSESAESGGGAAR